jgi:hypothetical protein
MLFDQLRAGALAGAVLIAGVCGGLAMTGGSDTPPGKAVAPAPRVRIDPAVALVEQLGSADFAEREAAQKELRKLGLKAEPAIKAGVKSEDPEVRERCAKLLIEIRKDALDALAKSFDSAAENPSDHPLWKRFKILAGDTRASRELFAQIIKNPDRLARLDAAETGPEAAARQYRDACTAVGRDYRRLMAILAEIIVWPGDLIDETAYLLFLGSYAGTDRAPPEEEDARRLFDVGEGRIHFGRGLVTGLRGEQLVADAQKGTVHTERVAEGTDRVFAKLLAGWLVNRTNESLLYRGFELAVTHRAREVLPVARTIAANEKRPVGGRCGALRAIAQFGAPADLPLFTPLFDDKTVVILPPPPSAFTPGPRSRRFQVRDQALGLALLLCDQDPAEYGFPYAKDRFRRDNGRPDVANYEAEGFGFGNDEDARTAAHTKAKAFLAKQKPKTFDEQVNAAEAEVKKLGLVEVATVKDGIDTRFPIAFEGKDGPVSLPAGSAVLVELPKPVREMRWQAGVFKPEAIGDKDGPEFAYVLCKWTADGKLTWVTYRKSAGK